MMDQACRTLAYPSGDHDERVADFTRRAGYDAACTLPAIFPRHPDPYLFPRVSVQRNDSLAEFRRKVSRTGRFVRSSPLAGPARRVYLSLRKHGRPSVEPSSDEPQHLLPDP